MQRIAVLLAGCLLLTLSGCAMMYQAPVQPPPGALFAQIQAPLTVNFEATEVDGGKTGSDTHQYILIPFLWQSIAWSEPASIEAAGRNGGLTRIDYADYEMFNVLGIYTRMTITAHGQ